MGGLAHMVIGVVRSCADSPRCRSSNLESGSQLRKHALLIKLHVLGDVEGHCFKNFLNPLDQRSECEPTILLR